MSFGFNTKCDKSCPANLFPEDTNIAKEEAILTHLTVQFTVVKKRKQVVIKSYLTYSRQQVLTPSVFYEIYFYAEV